MDKKYQRLQEQVDHAKQLQTLAANPAFPYFRDWVLAKRGRYERILHDPSNRADHLTLALAVEASETLTALLKDFDNDITQGLKARKELEDAASGQAAKSYTATGRNLRTR